LYVYDSSVAGGGGGGGRVDGVDRERKVGLATCSLPVCHSVAVQPPQPGINQSANQSVRLPIIPRLSILILVPPPASAAADRPTLVGVTGRSADDAAGRPVRRR